MRLLGIDFETTGLDTGKDRIVEVGAVLWDTDLNTPLVTYGDFVWDQSAPPALSPEVTAVNGIENWMVTEFGKHPRDVIEVIDEMCSKYNVSHFVAHNAENFDRPMLTAEIKRYPFWEPKLLSLPWIDTRTDIPFKKEPSSRRLNHIAADLGFINPFAHRAVFDVLTMLRVLSNYNINEVLEYQAIPFVTVQAFVSYNDRQLAKDARYSWEQIGVKKYPKMWVKRIKQNMLDTERSQCKFEIKELT